MRCSLWHFTNNLFVLQGTVNRFWLTKNYPNSSNVFGIQGLQHGLLVNGKILQIREYPAHINPSFPVDKGISSQDWSNPEEMTSILDLEHWQWRNRNGVLWLHRSLVSKCCIHAKYSQKLTIGAKNGLDHFDFATPAQQER